MRYLSTASHRATDLHHHAHYLTRAGQPQPALTSSPAPGSTARIMLTPVGAPQVDVNGPNASPVFKFLKENTPADMGGSADIDWNFAKFVVRLLTYHVCAATIPWLAVGPEPLACLIGSTACFAG